MKNFILKLLISIVFLYIFFELTIGLRMDYFKKKIDVLNDHQTRIELREKIKDELRKGIEKENYFTVEERVLIKDFIIKLREEINLDEGK